MCKFSLVLLPQDFCGNNLCTNNATCQTGFTERGYRCWCTEWFEGQNCVKGKISDSSSEFCVGGTQCCSFNLWLSHWFSTHRGLANDLILCCRGTLNAMSSAEGFKFRRFHGKQQFYTKQRQNDSPMVNAVENLHSYTTSACCM